jgi:pyruvate,water dikinase
MTRHFSFLARRVTSFERTVDDFAEQTTLDALASRPLLELRNDLAAFLDIRCHRWLNASLADSAALLSYGLLQRLVQPDLNQDERGLHNSLLKGLRDIVSSAPIVELWELSRTIRSNDDWRELVTTRNATALWSTLQSGDEQFSGLRRAIDAYLDKWGFRCSGELMLTVPSYQEQPEPLLAILQAYVASDRESPHERLRTQELDRAEITSKVLSRMHNDRRHSWPLRKGRAWLAAIALRWAQASIAFRERARLKQAMLYGRCRRIVLEIGDRLVQQGRIEATEDIFFLTVGEILELLSGGAMFPDRIGELAVARRRWHGELRDSTPPDSFRIPEGDYLASEPDGANSDRSSVAPENHGRYAGMGACGGMVTGPAAILTDVTQCARLSEGDILVTRQTDPGWAPVFFLIKGLVMERGGMLSHGAILAREYGIPTVVGVPDATRQIAQGQMIQVDGDRGVVRSIDR